MSLDMDAIFSEAQKKAESQSPKKYTKKKNKDKDKANNKKEQEITDIITFAESGSFLKRITLYPWQRIILKAMYMGTYGNEDISFTPNEWEKIKEDLDEENFNAIKHKFDEADYYPKREELVLCLGRRSFKSFLTSIIALYEAYKLLSQHCPQDKYGIDPLKPIWIINVATNQEQAKIVFEEVEAKVRTSDFFKSRIGKHRAEEIHFLTDSDMEVNQEIESGTDIKKTEGSVVLVAGNSNSAGLRGHAAIMLIYDEIAHFVDSSGNASDRAIYNALQPSLHTFNWVDEEGKSHQDGKSVLISSPTTRNRIFYERYQRALAFDSGGVGFRLPTWKANPNITRDHLKENYQSDPNAFMQEFAAEFSYGGTEALFSPDMIDRCMERGMKRNLVNKQGGQPNIRYYVHVDPAKTGDNYALVVLHLEDVVLENGDESYRVVLDHTKIWVPIPDNDDHLKSVAEEVAENDNYNVMEVVKGKINPNIVDEYVIGLDRNFNLASVTYDHWESSASIERLKNRKLPVSVLTFAGKSKTTYYSSLYSIVSNDLLDIIPSPIIADELKFLQKKKNRGGWTVDTLDDEHMDDIADCIAGAAFVAVNDDFTTKPLPKVRTVRVGWK
jgi:hypothetical protein